MHATNIRVRTDGDLVEGPRHHGDEHIEQYDHGPPVVDSEHYVSETLGESTLVTLAKLHRPRILQPEHRPVDRAKRVLQTATRTANGNKYQLSQMDPRDALSHAMMRIVLYYYCYYYFLTLGSI